MICPICKNEMSFYFMGIEKWCCETVGCELGVMGGIREKVDRFNEICYTNEYGIVEMLFTIFEFFWHKHIWENVQELTRFCRICHREHPEDKEYWEEYKRWEERDSPCDAKLIWGD